MTTMKIIADSCCDLSNELKERLGVITVPFVMDLGENQYTDDDTLDLPRFKVSMAEWQGRIGTAAPSPQSFYDAIKKTGTSFCLTISSRLSASFENAKLAGDMLNGVVPDCMPNSGVPNSNAPKNLPHEVPTDVQPQGAGSRVHIIDSLSASAGETLVAVKLRQLIDAHLPEIDIVERLEKFIAGMKTYFVLDSVENLLKNGRLNRITGRLTSLLHIKPLLGSDGQGQIKLYGQARGRKQTIEKLVGTVARSGRPTEGESLVISHCDNPSLADDLAARIRELYNFAEILIVPTGGLSSVYADKNGIVLAY